MLMEDEEGGCGEDMYVSQQQPQHQQFQDNSNCHVVYNSGNNWVYGHNNNSSSNNNNNNHMYHHGGGGGGGGNGNGMDMMMNNHNGHHNEPGFIVSVVCPQCRCVFTILGAVL